VSNFTKGKAGILGTIAKISFSILAFSVVRIEFFPIHFDTSQIAAGRSPSSSNDFQSYNDFQPYAQSSPGYTDYRYVPGYDSTYTPGYESTYTPVETGWFDTGRGYTSDKVRKTVNGPTAKSTRSPSPRN